MKTKEQSMPMYGLKKGFISKFQGCQVWRQTEGGQTVQWPKNFVLNSKVYNVNSSCQKIPTKNKIELHLSIIYDGREINLPEC